MEKCKFCQAELEENSTVCPVCGKDNAAEEEAVTAASEAESQEEAPAATEEPEAPSVSEEEKKEEQAETGEPKTELEEASQEGEPAEQAQTGTPGIQVTPGKIALAVAAVVVLLALLIALVVYGVDSKKKQENPSVSTETVSSETDTPATVPETTPATVPADGNPEDVTCKGTYTVTDDEILADRDTVVATVGDRELTNGVLQVYYWRAVQDFLSNYGAYASYFGLDYTKPLDTQLSREGDTTWQQYFLKVALDSWHQVQAMCLDAEDAQAAISQEDQEYLDNMRKSLEDTATNYDLTLEELLNNNFGPGASFDEFRIYQTDYCLGVPYYYTQCEGLNPTDKELEDYFAAHEADYATNNITRDGVLVDVRHILIMPEGGTTGEDGNTTHSEEEWNACQKKAAELLDQWKAGEMTEESFAQLANAHSSDGGSNTNGGLYENVYVGQMVTEFNDWCFDESRKIGDTDLVKTQFGYHIMYFSDSRPQWRYYAQQDWMTEQTTALLENMMEAHPIQVSYDKIALGLAPLN